MKSYVPCKANPANMKFLRYLHSLLNDGSSFNKFLESRNDIYVCIDPESAYYMHEYKYPMKLYSFLTCRRINASDTDSKQLKIYCTPYSIVYCIDNVYFNKSINLNTNDYCEIFEIIMKENAASKRDAFIMLKLSEEHSIILERKLLDMGYYKSDIIDDNIHTYFKSPII